MDFKLNEDQEALVTALDKIASAFLTKPTDFHGFALHGSMLEAELEAGQYFDIASIPEWGPICAVIAVERLAQTPYAVETALSMVVRGHLPGQALRPVALVEHGRPGRFVAGAKTVIVIERGHVSIAYPDPGETEAIESLFAYPMGRLKSGITAQRISANDCKKVRQWLQVALAAEISGLLQAAIAAATDHITHRRQFGRQLGTFQALRHRMAECAVLAGGVKWLTLKAAYTANPADAALAAFHAQESATRVVYDVHQMLAAMGMTLEHPLHLWTYRLKALLSELDGRPGQAVSVAANCFLEGGRDS